MGYDLTATDMSRGEAYLKKIAQNLGVDVGKITHDITAPPQSRMDAYLQAIIANMGSGGGGGSIDPAVLAQKQDKIDEALQTDDKSVVGAINEIFSYFADDREPAVLDLEAWKEQTAPLKATLTSVAFASAAPTEADTIDFGNGIKGSVDGTALTVRCAYGITIPDATEMFSGFSALETIQQADFTVTGPATRMFAGCTALRNIDAMLNRNQFYGTTDASYMFAGCTALERTSFDFSFYNAESVAHAFEGCTKLVDVHVSADAAEDVSHMFSGCNKLGNIRVRAPRATNATHLFDGCTSMQTGYFPGSMVTDASYMFSGCTELVSVETSNDGVIGGNELSVDTSHMFAGCSMLQRLELQYVNFSNFKAFAGMFEGISDGVVATVADDNSKSWLETNAATTGWPSSGSIIVQALPVPDQQVYRVNGQTGPYVSLTAANVEALPQTGGTATGPIPVKPDDAVGVQISSDASGSAIKTGEGESALNMVMMGKTASAPATVQMFDGGYNPVKISGVADPTEDYDAATKGYVDSKAGGGSKVLLASGSATTSVGAQEFVEAQVEITLPTGADRTTHDAAVSVSVRKCQVLPVISAVGWVKGDSGDYTTLRVTLQVYNPLPVDADSGSIVVQALFIPK